MFYIPNRMMGEEFHHDVLILLLNEQCNLLGFIIGSSLLTGIPHIRSCRSSSTSTALNSVCLNTSNVGRLGSYRTNHIFQNHGSVMKALRSLLSFWLPFPVVPISRPCPSPNDARHLEILVSPTEYGTPFNQEF
jgi:hypothetical protein